MNRLTLSVLAIVLASACGSHHRSRYDSEPTRTGSRTPTSHESSSSSPDTGSSSPNAGSSSNTGSSSSNTGSSSSNTGSPSSNTGSSSSNTGSSSSNTGSSSSNTGSSSSNTGSSSSNTGSSSSNTDPTPSDPPAPPVPAWHAVVDREMPYFECTKADQSTFEVEMTTTDAVVWFPDNSSVDGTVDIDANDDISFTLGTYLNGPATNAQFGEDMLLAFDVGSTHCRAFAYELAGGFDATYEGTGWDDDAEGVYTTQWTLTLHQGGGASALEETYFEFDGDTSYQNYGGVYYIDQGVIHVALIGSGILEGTVDAQHDIDDTLHDYYMTPTSN